MGLRKRFFELLCLLALQDQSKTADMFFLLPSLQLGSSEAEANLFPKIHELKNFKFNNFCFPDNDVLFSFQRLNYRVSLQMGFLFLPRHCRGAP